MTTVAVRMPFSKRLVALLRDPTSWENLTDAQRRRALNDFYDTQTAAVREHSLYRERLNPFFDDVYAKAVVSVRIARVACGVGVLFPSLPPWPHGHRSAQDIDAQQNAAEGGDGSSVRAFYTKNQMQHYLDYTIDTAEYLDCLRVLIGAEWPESFPAELDSHRNVLHEVCVWPNQCVAARSVLAACSVLTKGRSSQCNTRLKLLETLWKKLDEKGYDTGIIDAHDPLVDSRNPVEIERIEWE